MVQRIDYGAKSATADSAIGTSLAVSAPLTRLVSTGLKMVGLERGFPRFTSPDFQSPEIHDELRGAVGHDTVEGREQGVYFALPAIKLFRNQESIRYIARAFHDVIGTVTIILVPRPAAVLISSFASICAALSRMLSSPIPSLCSSRCLVIPNPLSFT